MAKQKPRTIPVARSSPIWLPIVILIVAGIWAYSTSFRGAFVGDDQTGIVENPHIRSLWPPSVPLTSPKETTLAGRPVVSLSFALNYALAPARVRDAMSPDPNGRPDDPFYENVWGYHAVNLIVHLLAGLALFGVIRRTLMTPVLRDRFARASTPLAFAVVLIWLVHPLQTSSVTFVVQRAEALMGLMFFATMYAVIRASDSDFRSARWIVAAVVACALGMLSKEVMGVAPVLAGLWIWIFRPDVRLTGPPVRLMAGLAATWIVFAAVALSGARTSFIGFNVGGWTWWPYLQAQAAVIAHYLRLVFWPQGLNFNYIWFPPASFGEVAPQFLLIGALALATAFAILKRSPVGWVGAVFFLILAPTSSILPISTEVAAEFRMYVPLASIVALIVIGGFGLFHRSVRKGRPGPAGMPWTATAWVLVAVVAVVLGVTTRARSRVYDSVDTITADIVRQQPHHAEAQLTHATHLIRQNRFADAELTLRMALSLPLPTDVDETKSRAAMHMYLGVALTSQKKFAEGAAELEQAIALGPTLELAHGLLADAQLTERQPRAAVATLDRAIAANPNSARLLARAAWVLATSSDAAVRNGARAVEYAERAVRIQQGQDVAGLDTLAAAYAEAGQFDKALQTERAAVDLDARQGRSQLSGMLQAHLSSLQAGRPIRTLAW